MAEETTPTASATTNSSQSTPPPPPPDPNLPTATYRVLVKNNAHTRDVRDTPKSDKQAGQ